MLKNFLFSAINPLLKFALARSGIYFRIKILEDTIHYLESNNKRNLTSEGLLVVEVLQAGMTKSLNRPMRIGSANDGGYLLEEPNDSEKFCLSFGIGKNTDFEKDISRYVTNVVAYDGSISRLPKNRIKNLTWEKKFIGELDDENHAQINTVFEECSQTFNWHNSGILKMDIEGYEYEAISQISNENLSRCSQIVMELHFVVENIANHSSKLLELFRKLNSTHYLAHVHGNNYAFSAIFDGIRIPDALELTWISRTRSSSSEVENREIAQDQPNNPYLPDFRLNFLAAESHI